MHTQMDLQLKFCSRFLKLFLEEAAKHIVLLTVSNLFLLFWLSEFDFQTVELK